MRGESKEKCAQVLAGICCINAASGAVVYLYDVELWWQAMLAGANIGLFAVAIYWAIKLHQMFGRSDMDRSDEQEMGIFVGALCALFASVIAIVFAFNFTINALTPYAAILGV